MLNQVQLQQYVTEETETRDEQVVGALVMKKTRVPWVRFAPDDSVAPYTNLST